VRTTGAAVVTAGAVSSIGAGVDTVADGAVVAGVVGVGVLGGVVGVVSADSSTTAAAMPIEATMPNIVETPIPAVAIRARWAGCRRVRRRDGARAADPVSARATIGVAVGGGSRCPPRSGSTSVIVVGALVLVFIVVIVVVLVVLVVVVIVVVAAAGRR
jgi:hypothetical protein